MKRTIRRAFGLQSERGAALVEFALVVPFLMMIMCATIDFGLAVFTLTNLTAAVREGGRYAATKPYPGPIAGDTTVKNKVYNYIITLKTPMTPSAVKAAIGVTAPDANRNITVSITNFQFQPMTPLASLMGLSTINLNRSATFRWELAN
jgi:Flp pilus assembly pilin Flp